MSSHICPHVLRDTLSPGLGLLVFRVRGLRRTLCALSYLTETLRSC